MIRRVPLAVFAFVSLVGATSAEPLSRGTEIDFFRDVPSRNLKGLAARSDGRLVAGPVLTELNGPAPADLLWSLEATEDPATWIVGTGPDGRIFEVTIDRAKTAFTAREFAKLDEAHVFALARLPDGALLAGTSPQGALCLVREGKQVTRVALPVDSIFDLLVLDGKTAFVATGNPGRIYRVDLGKFSRSPAVAEKLADAKLLAERGITLFGEVRDRNLRRLARLSDGRIIAGSSPRGNVYAFTQNGGAPDILQENRDAEVTDLLPTPDGGFYAALTFSGSSNEARITPPKNAKDPESGPLMPAVAERFGGRSAVVWFPPNGFPETITARANTALYRIARQGDVLLLAGGEQGEIVGYDITQRLSITYAGSVSSQLNSMVAMPHQPGQFMVLRNNAPGFALLDFSAAGPRSAETRRIDLNAPSRFGALRFNRLRNVAPENLRLELTTSNGSDEIEGWSPWIDLDAVDQGWSAPALRGRYAKLRLQIPAQASADLQLDKATLYALPQNRRPQLQEFRFLSSNFALVPTPEPPASPIVSVGQLLQGQKDDDKRKGAFLGSQIIPSPGTQVVLWTVVDPDGDNLVCTFSVRREGDAKWTDVVVNTRDPFAQFDISHLPDGLYFTRLVATEAEPRQREERLSTTFETDDLLIDRTPPQLIAASARAEGDRFVVTVHGRDARSLLSAVELAFNHGLRESTEQPADGILDGHEETFVFELPLASVAGATSVEATLYDAVGNAKTQRLSW